MMERIDHLGVAVHSIDEARQFWETLGLQVSEIEEVPREGVRVAFLPVGQSAIELLEPIGSDSPIGRFLESHGPGLHHLCLATDSIHADDARLRDAGIELLRAQPTRGAGGCWVQFVHPRSAGGVLLELSATEGGEAGR